MVLGDFEETQDPRFKVKREGNLTIQAFDFIVERNVLTKFSVPNNSGGSLFWDYTSLQHTQVKALGFSCWHITRGDVLCVVDLDFKTRAGR
jgi:hypothetical protein